MSRRRLEAHQRTSVLAVLSCWSLLHRIHSATSSIQTDNALLQLLDAWIQDRSRKSVYRRRTRVDEGRDSR